MRRIALILTLFWLAACGHGSSSSGGGGPDKMVLQPVSYKQIRGWGEDKFDEALSAFVKSCGAFDRMNDNDATGEGLLLAPAVVWRESCRKAESLPTGDTVLARRFFEEYFIPVLVTNNGNSAGLITGYYEPLLKGSRIQHPPFKYPVYGLPEPGTPSYSRTQIDLGMLNGHAPVIAYVDDPVRLFFLHVQGSGRIQLEDGSVIRVGYAGTNGMPYTAIGKVLVDRGFINKESLTMPLLRQWLYDHPEAMWKVMWENQSYVFFREMQGEPVGTEQVPLTPGRSVAVDMKYIPLGAPVFIDTVLPETPDSPMAIHRKLMVAQDSGQAIKGPNRIDMFFGYGAAAEQVAGRMKVGGQVTLLLPRALARNVLAGQ